MKNEGAPLTIKQVKNSLDGSVEIFLYNQIGNTYDEDGYIKEWGIDGDSFAQMIRRMNEDPSITKVKIRINSNGGSMVQGFAIFSAILSLGKKAVTINDGLAASMAGLCLLAAPVRMGYDYSLFMAHSPYVENQTPEDADMLNAFKASAVKMFAQYAEMSNEDAEAILDGVNWKDAEECFKDGIYTHKPLSSVDQENAQMNMKRVTSEIKEAYTGTITADYANKVYSICNILKEDNMKLDGTFKVLAITDQVAADKVDNVLSEKITGIKNQLDTATARVTELEGEIQSEKEKVTASAERVTALEAELQAEKEKNANAEASALIEKAEEIVNSAVKAGKIKNDATVKADWVKEASKDKASLERVKNLFNGMGVSAKKVTERTEDPKPEGVISAGSIMAEIDRKTRSRGIN